MTELATFLAALPVHYQLSRVKIREFLAGWCGVTLPVGTVDRGIREAGQPMAQLTMHALKFDGLVLARMMLSHRQQALRLDA